MTVALAAAGGAGAGGSAMPGMGGMPAAGGQAGASAVTIAMPGKYYSPSDVAVLTGTTVTWRNDDLATHTATADGDAFDSGPIGPGATFARTFDRPGVYALHCTVHRFMRGIVRVYALVLTGPAAAVQQGARVAVAGVVPAAAAGGMVVLEQRPAGAARWSSVAHARAAASGSFSFQLRARVPLVVRARSGATASPLVRLHVAPRVTAARSGAAIAVATAPARPGARALLQVYDRERFAFVTRGTGRLDAAGRAQLPLAGTRPHDHVRVLVQGSGGWSDGRSSVLLLR